MSLKNTNIINIFFFLLPALGFAQIPVSINDIDLASQPNFDNLSYQNDTFFVVPVQYNEYVELTNMSFNLRYDPSIITLVNNSSLSMINSTDYLSNQQLDDISLFSQGSIFSEVYSISDQDEMLTIYFNSSTPISEADFDAQNGTLLFLPFIKNDPCYEGPISLQFWNGFYEGNFLNPDNIYAASINFTYNTDNNQIYSIDGIVNLNLPNSDVSVNGLDVQSQIFNGIPPYSYNWTDKLGLTLSNDSVFNPEQTGDYFLYASDSQGCVSVNYFSFEYPTFINEIDPSLIVGPNPFSSFINIEQAGFFKYSLYDFRGRIVRIGEGYNNVQLDMSKLFKSVYFLKVYNNFNSQTVKLISL